MRKIDELLSNIWCVPIIFLIGLLGWFFKLDTVAVPIIAVYCLAVFIFCTNVNNILPIVFAIPFFIASVDSLDDVGYLAIALGIFIIGVIYFIVKKIITKAEMKKGKMFWGFVCALIAYCLGGILVNFNIINFAIILVLTLLTYFVYWIAINFTKDLPNYFAKILIIIGVVLTIQLFIEYLRCDETFLHAILSKNVINIGLQNINVVAIYLMLAMVASFYLAYKSTKDYLFILLGVYFAGCTYFTYSRMGICICLIALVSMLVYLFVRSKHKKILILLGIGSAILIAVQLTLLYLNGYSVIERILQLGISGNGRQDLWPWCWEKFINNPLFGIGFVSKDPVPSLITTDEIVLAHNSLLQYLTSLGIIGTLIIGYYYFKKYQIVLSKFNMEKLFVLIQLLIIALSGITDQSPTMDVFILCITICFVAVAELDNGDCTFKEQIRLKKLKKKQSEFVKVENLEKTDLKTD